MAKNMEELNVKVDVKTNVANARTLTQSALKMHQMAGDALSNGDEELAYLYFMRYMNLVTTMKRTADFKSNPKYYTELLGPNKMRDSMDKAETLSKSLINRYDERQAEEVAEKLGSLTVSSSADEEKQLILPEEQGTVF